MELEPYQSPDDMMVAKPSTVSGNSKSMQKQMGRATNVGIDSSLAIFKPRTVEAGIKREVIVDYHPLASLQKGKCIEFLVPKTNTLYLAMNKTVLRTKFKIVTDDNKNPAVTEKVSCVNAAGTSMFRSCDIELQQKLISGDIGLHYAFKAYVDYVMYSSEEYLNSTAQLNLFFKDTPFAFSKTDLDGTGANTGLISRHEFTSGGKECLVISPLAHDITQLTEFLPPNIEIKFRFWPNNDDFFILSGETTERYKFLIEDCTLQMTGYEVGDQVMLRHHQILSKTNARYHYKRSVLKSYQIPSDLTTWTIFQFLQGDIPCDMVLAFFSAESFVGSQNTNPFEAAHHNLIYLSLETEGYQTLTFRPQYDNNVWAREYKSMYDSGHTQTASFTPLVKYRDYAGGYCFYRFALGNNQVERLLRKREGQSRLIINFSKKLDNALSCLVYAKYHTFLEIDLAKNVYLSSECN